MHKDTSAKQGSNAKQKTQSVAELTDATLNNDPAVVLEKITYLERWVLEVMLANTYLVTCMNFVATVDNFITIAGAVALILLYLAFSYITRVERSSEANATVL